MTDEPPRPSHRKRQRPPSVSSRYTVTTEQVKLFSILLREFVTEAATRGKRRLSTLPSYRRLTLGAYACGFVFSDADYDKGARLVELVQKDPKAFAGMSFSRVRLYVHYMVRAERWDDQNPSEIGGAIHTAVTCGHF